MPPVIIPLRFRRLWTSLSSSRPACSSTSQSCGSTTTGTSRGTTPQSTGIQLRFYFHGFIYLDRFKYDKRTVWSCNQVKYTKSTTSTFRDCRGDHSFLIFSMKIQKQTVNQQFIFIPCHKYCIVGNKYFILALPHCWTWLWPSSRSPCSSGRCTRPRPWRTSSTCWPAWWARRRTIR